MNEYSPIYFSIALLAAVTLVGFLFIRFLNPSWWRVRRVRKVLWIVPMLCAVNIALWAAGIVFKIHFLSMLWPGVAAQLLSMLIVVVTLPVSGAIHGINFLIDRFSKKKNIDSSRRTFLKRSAIAIPTLAAVGSTIGIANSFAQIRVPEIPLFFPNLPQELVGLRIAHITDVHLGYYVHLKNIEALCERIALHKPDVVLLTGDHCDNLIYLADELTIISQLKPRYGVYASLGNHEYYRGVRAVRNIFEKSTVPLMVNEGVTIAGTKIFLAAIDDPQVLGRDNKEFLRTSTDTAMNSAPTDAFHLLMSHRPEGFNHAAALGIELTLSGHTHGGQIGFAGRSMFEGLFPEKYLWGLYKKGNSQLYTSSGCGHWLPIRIGCPAEAPIYILNAAS